MGHSSRVAAPYGALSAMPKPGLGSAPLCLCGDSLVFQFLDFGWEFALARLDEVTRDWI